MEVHGKGVGKGNVKERGQRAETEHQSAEGKDWKGNRKCYSCGKVGYIAIVHDSPRPNIRDNSGKVVSAAQDAEGESGQKQEEWGGVCRASDVGEQVGAIKDRPARISSKVGFKDGHMVEVVRDTGCNSRCMCKVC